MTVKDELAELGLSIQQAADLFKISYQAVYQWKTIPNERRKELEDHLGLDQGGLGRTTSRQGFRADIHDAPPGVVPWAKMRGLVQKNLATGETRPSNDDPNNVDEGFTLVFLD